MLFVLSYKDWNVVKPGAWLVRAPPGAQESQDLFPILSMRLALTAGIHSVRAVSRQIRSKVRGLLCFVSEA